MESSPSPASENRIALLGIILEDPASVGPLNDLLHQYSPWIMGRMGLPYRERQLSVISLIVDAPPDVISALSGKIGMLPGVNAKTLHAKLPQS